MKEETLRKEIFKIVGRILEERSVDDHFKPGEDRITYAAPFYDHEEIEQMINAILNGWFGAGKLTRRFEIELSKLTGTKIVIMTSSGSSANLLSVSALLSPEQKKEVKVNPEDEVLTSALITPGSFNPILQNNLVPVLLDVEKETYNINADNLKLGLSDATKAIIIPHTFGNPSEIDSITDFAEEHNLFLIEDACYALGSRYNGRHVGSFGTFGTFSFSPGSQITTGEGGAVATKDKELSNIVLSLRDWGRACTLPICDPLHCPDKGCPKSVSYREDYAHESLPEDYDKRYMYLTQGYNFEPTEIQAAMGIAQLKKFSQITERRKENFRILYEEIQNHEESFILPETLPKSDPCWYAFPLTIRENAKFDLKEIIEWFTQHNIEIRPLFANTAYGQPAYKKSHYRIAGNLANSEHAIHTSFSLGIHPGINDEMMKYIISTIRRLINKHKK